MGLNLTISLDKDIRQIDAFFDDLKFKAITQSARQGLNRAAERTRSAAIKEIRKRRKLKLQDLKGSKKKNKMGFVTLRKARGSNIAELEARINFSGIPLPLILFIVGQRTPKRQTKANRLRKPRRFEIVQGKRTEKKGLFVQKANRGGFSNQVFRRRDPSDRSKGMVAQSAPSVAELLRTKSNVMRKIENGAIALMQKEYDRALAFNLSKLKL